MALRDMQVSKWSNIFNFTTKDDIGISELNNYINIYPNPANDKLFVNLGIISENAIIEIVNSEGKILLKDIYPINTCEKIIYINHLNSGVYLLQIKNNNFVINEKLIIK